MKKRPFSIKTYASIYAIFLLLMLSVLGYVTFREVAGLEEQFKQSSHANALEEIEAAISMTFSRAEFYTAKFAEWEEVRQQLQNPLFYAYWYKYRAMHNNILPANVIDVGVYDSSGKVLAKIDTAMLPETIIPTAPPLQIWKKEGILYIHAVAPVIDPMDKSIIGYSTTLSLFLPEFLRLGDLSVIDQNSFEFDIAENERVERQQFTRRIRFQLTSDPLANALKDLMVQTAIRFSIMLALLTLVIFPFVSWLIGRPVRQIAQHIDLLKRNTDQQVAESLEKQLPIQELDKVRLSLNDYHRQLIEMHSDLDEKNRELWKLAHHDPLTGVRNRRAFDEYFRELVTLLNDGRHKVCLALIDINHFKAINDTYGHKVGDELLIAISQTIRQVLRKGEHLFRLGGDEFAALFLDCSPPLAQQIAERLARSISSYPFHQHGIKEPVRISIGLAHADLDDRDSVLSLLWQADVAMYSAKRPSHTHIAHFSPEMAEGAKGLFSNWIHTAVYDAVTHGNGLLIHYQPIISLDDGRINYFEALLRIKYEDEIIVPSHIFPLVEARRLELDLDRIIIQRILMDLSSKRIPPGTGVSINLSAPALVNSEILQQLSAFQPLMKNYRLVVEITETSLITQIRTATENLTQLQRMGFDIALDDFGSGYSSLRYLAQMPVDIVKFDISLTHLANDLSQRVILNHLTQMINDAGYQLVAEGIESLALSKKLRELGFLLGQGYFYGRPQAADNLSGEFLPEQPPRRELTR